MSSTPCPSCVVVLNQQQEQNISHHKQCEDIPGNHSKSHHKQCEDIPGNHSKNVTKNCTVVENGRVVVKPLQQLTTETAD